MSVAEKASNYFEGKLQLRNCGEEVLGFIERELEREHGKVWVAKEVQLKEGLDLYMSSNNFLKKLGKRLKSEFKGIVKETVKLHTETKDGKKLYRLTVLFRKASFDEGDVGDLKGDRIIILKVDDQVLVKDMDSGKKSRHPFDYVTKYFRKE